MKKTYTTVAMSIVLLVTASSIHAQDSTQSGVIKLVNKSNEKADNLLGKKIQQQSLSNKKFQHLDTVAAAPASKKKHAKRKHQY